MRLTHRAFEHLSKKVSHTQNIHVQEGNDARKLYASSTGAPQAAPEAGRGVRVDRYPLAARYIVHKVGCVYIYMDPHESYVQWKLHGIMGIGQPERLLPEALRCPPIGGKLDRVRSTTPPMTLRDK